LKRLPCHTANHGEQGAARLGFLDAAPSSRIGEDHGMIQNPADYKNPFGTVAEQIKRARAEREQRAEFYRETHEIVSRAFDAVDLRDINGNPVTEVARRILLAGMKRRAEIADDSLAPPKGSMARRIIDAARKRDGLEPLK
jgi:hypothetical protein